LSSPYRSIACHGRYLSIWSGGQPAFFKSEAVLPILLLLETFRSDLYNHNRFMEPERQDRKRLEDRVKDSREWRVESRESETRGWERPDDRGRMTEDSRKDGGRRSEIGDRRSAEDSLLPRTSYPVPVKDSRESRVRTKTVWSLECGNQRTGKNRRTDDGKGQRTKTAKAKSKERLSTDYKD
jgi:hypothetical protein